LSRKAVRLESLTYDAVRLESLTYGGSMAAGTPMNQLATGCVEISRGPFFSD
jgi:hypothetical protein